ncbi:MAG: tyrosine--tRNA ligase [Nitriliruptoraceae bacterium]
MTAEHPIDLLRARGFVQDITDEPGLREAFDAGPVTYYVGFDPTAPSLHAGNLVGMMAMAWLQRLGHRPIAIAGGATGRIGDPSGRDSERTLLDDATIAAHLAGIRAQLARVLDLDSADGGMLLDNAEWWNALGFIEVLRDVGKHFSVNAMIAKESVRRRLDAREQGISYTEFSYQLLQAYDFLHLHRTHGCVLQCGGSDQWGNIVAGIDLIRRATGREAYGLTWPLLTTADGAKFGKSAGNAVWLDAAMTTPYAYFQFWVNTADDDVVRFLKLFTFLDLEEIDALAAEVRDRPHARVAHRTLAREATRIVHGDAGVERAEHATRALFGDAPLDGLDDATIAEVFAEAPSSDVSRADLDAGLGVLELIRRVGAAASNGEARRLVEQSAVRLDNVVVDDPQRVVTTEDLAGRRMFVIKVGKKRHFLARVR